MGKKTLILTEVRKRFFGETDVCVCATHDHDDHDDDDDRRRAIFSLLLLLLVASHFVQKSHQNSFSQEPTDTKRNFRRRSDDVVSLRFQSSEILRPISYRDVQRLYFAPEIRLETEDSPGRRLFAVVHERHLGGALLTTTTTTIKGVTFEEDEEEDEMDRSHSK